MQVQGSAGPWVCWGRTAVRAPGRDELGSGDSHTGPLSMPQVTCVDRVDVTLWSSKPRPCPEFCTSVHGLQTGWRAGFAAGRRRCPQRAEKRKALEDQPGHQEQRWQLGHARSWLFPWKSNHWLEAYWPGHRWDPSRVHRNQTCLGYFPKSAEKFLISLQSVKCLPVP